MHVMKWMGMAMVVGAVCVAHAGNLNSPAVPGEAGSAMYTLEDVYNRLDAGTAGAKRTGTFVEPSAGPGSSGHTVDEIMATAPGTNANAAAAGDVLTGKVFWGLNSGSWGQQAGTVPAGANVNGADGSLVVTVTDGLYSGSKTATASDSDLVTGNIRAGANIFGVAGKTEVVDTTSGDAVAGDVLTGKKAWVDGEEVTGTASISAYPALVPKTGQTTSYATGDDGDLEPGVAWPGTRFTDNSDGTVTDNLTGLIWLKDADAGDGAETWANALSICNSLANGQQGLIDGSSAGDWRLPTVQELQSLIDYGRYNVALPSGHPFTGEESSYYWSSTTHADVTDLAWGVNLLNGYVLNGDKANSMYLWPVRGGE
jgi:hypothetical protein